MEMAGSPRTSSKTGSSKLAGGMYKQIDYICVSVCIYASMCVHIFVSMCIFTYNFGNLYNIQPTGGNYMLHIA